MSSKPGVLGFGRTSGDVNLPIRVGGTGQIDGSGEPVGGGKGPKPMALYYGRTSGGDNVPLRVDSSGKLNIDWNL
jgi:hypothetical protein